MKTRAVRFLRQPNETEMCNSARRTIFAGNFFLYPCLLCVRPTNLFSDDTEKIRLLHTFVFFRHTNSKWLREKGQNKFILFFLPRPTRFFLSYLSYMFPSIFKLVIFVNFDIILSNQKSYAS